MRKAAEDSRRGMGGAHGYVVTRPLGGLLCFGDTLLCWSLWSQSLSSQSHGAGLWGLAGGCALPPPPPPPAPWPRQSQAGLSYLRVSCCSPDRSGGLRWVAASPLQFGKAGVIDALASTVTPSSSAPLQGPQPLPPSTPPTGQTRLRDTLKCLQSSPELWVRQDMDSAQRRHSVVFKVPMEEAVPSCPRWEQDLDMPAPYLPQVSGSCASSGDVHGVHGLQCKKATGLILG